ncbi:hypothetical protein JCM30471_03070 [Desulfuromonas carbonis]|uniref:dihydrolipoamide acetyltransferase family protein n=1 Tax=Desulfuromonas sp. DDH964 TaxID=1823759 RepID=UPI00078BDED2|nr:dihydrolipoamide acetyltransferase family protein [Desulfuromonas sp. DDH964]AMV71638.1 branched-chain alpha-keto acid dehydrogenase E2 subunit [Desulfuromonas sp. DDH964]
MATEITMPKLSDTMEEGTILKWHVAEGDRIARGDIIAEVETDKAAMEMEAFEDGTVAAIKVAEGETVPVGTLIAILDVAAAKQEKKDKEEKQEKKDKEEKQETEKEEKEEKKGTARAPAAAKTPVKPEAAEEEPQPAAQGVAPASRKEEAMTGARPGGQTPPASPAARRLAREKNVDLARVRGSGPGGRILVADIEQAEAGAVKGPATASSAAAPTSGKSVKIRRIVARKMVEAWETIPHFYVTVAVDMTDVIRFRKDLKVSINDFIVAATIRSLQEHSWVNSHHLDGEAVEQARINIAMAVATDRGLYNPVLKDCAAFSLRDISRKSQSLAEKAHLGKLTPEEMQDGTFTISNMGMLGVESFSAIITPPQVAALAVGTARGELVVDEHGESTIAPILRLTLSADHRALDGADAAEFLATLKSYLEAPVVLIACGSAEEEA